MNLHWHVRITQSSQFAEGFTLSFVHSVGLGRYVMISAHHYSFAQGVFYCLKNHLCSACSSFTLFQSQQPLIFFFNCLLILPFPECHIVKVRQHVPFQTGFFHLVTLIHVKFFDIFSWLSCSFFFFLSFLFKCWVFLCLNMAQLVDPFTYWRTSWMLPNFGNYE